MSCRSEEERDALVRLARSPEGEVVVDLRGTLPGRGAWVHPIAGCVDRLEREPGLLSRAFKEPSRTVGLGAAFRAVVKAALGDGLSVAAAGGGLVYGHDAVEAAVRGNAVVALIVASDASPRTVADVATPEIPATAVPLDREALGQRVGQGTLAVVGVRDVSCTVHLRRQLRRWARLG